MMTIRKTTYEDLDAVMVIYEQARRFMAQSGNPDQWGDGYPPRQFLEDDIAKGVSYVLQEGNIIVGTFSFAAMEEPTYKTIHDGAWLNDKPYGVIHRIASGGKTKGLVAACVEWCRDRCDTIRIDTHEDNLVMQHVLEKLGFQRCGTVYIENGSKRIAYQLV